MQLEKGMEVFWKKDPVYIGVIEEVYEYTNNVLVQFTKPKKFRVKVAESSVEVTDRQKAFNNEYAVINFSDDEINDLLDIFMDMALQTHDEKWFNELVEMMNS